MFTNDDQDIVMESNVKIVGSNPILRTLNASYPAHLNVEKPIVASQVDYWLDYAKDNLFVGDFKKLSSYFDELDSHLTLRSFMVGYSLTAADFAIWGALRANAIFNKQLKNGKLTTDNLSRWYQHMNSLPCVKEAFALLDNARDTAKDRSDKGSMDIPLPGAVEGQVVTRFPPEPSGYLHIGHAKAAILNNYFARTYKGKLIVRFDDTNPSKEKMEFEESIKEDLALLGIKPDVVVHTSDHFDKIYNLALGLINKGLAYTDDTETETMRNERFNGIESKNRNLPVEKVLELFEEMKKGSAVGLKYCLRAKIDMQDNNKCMRDPVIYRCNLTPHHITGTNWKMYPTYDFACPIVDSLDGVTHALRTIEYRDRNAQYEWFLEHLQLRKVHIWDFSRLNFVYTLLSKRKLTWFVEEKLVTGWDDPRFPTVRGIRRRGMTVDGLLAYILSQGASQREMLLEWDKIWAMNKKIIDPISPRHTALFKDDIVKVNVLDQDLKFHTKSVLKHKKNADLGEKVVAFGNEILLQQKDCIDLEVGEEVTLMDWGNVIIKKISKDNDKVTEIEIDLHLEGDFKKTKKKLTWLCAGSGDYALTPVVLHYYDYLITKKKLEEDEEVTDILNSKTEYLENALGDVNLKTLKKGDIIQLEREGYFICDQASSASDLTVHLIFIPDGKQESVSLRSVAIESTPLDKIEKKKSSVQTQKLAMYEIGTHYTNIEGVEVDSSKMYRVNPHYPDLLDYLKGTVKSSTAPKPKTESKKTQNAVPEPKTEAVNEDSLVSKLDIVVGKILEVRLHPDADSLYVEKIDVGEKEPREVVSGLVKFMKPEDLLGKTILVLKNLKPVAMRGIKSFAMVLCASNEDHTKVEFLVPPPGSLPGDRVFFEGHRGEPEEMLKPKKKVWETVQPDFTTREDLVAVWKGIPFQTTKGFVTAASLKNASIK